MNLLLQIPDYHSTAAHNTLDYNYLFMCVQPYKTANSMSCIINAEKQLIECLTEVIYPFIQEVFIGLLGSYM